ncbi:class I SAM-dependent methyltransferase [Halalkalibacter urbisdiaboli]|uniref:class I SAM-dependent methyltransferase n=1 Tax=Halalkalibacter urbisdiaboli TaxID=1960589 RepID=UPI000B43E9AB|nr:methyltransferase domain-containing protein [Halalkalibacter urbisdiaboli]
MSTIAYVKNILKDPNIASITPTSKSGVREVCSKMNLNQRVVIIEYGPATGVFTNYLLERITDNSLIVAVELNETFAGILENNIQDKRLKIHKDSAENIDQIMDQYDQKADYVISGIPFSLFTPQLRDNIVKKTKDVLNSGGKFLPYQTFFQKDRHLKDHLTKHFSSVQDGYFFRNIPPMRLYEAVKGEGKYF